MDAIGKISLITQPEEEWVRLIKESEERLDDELRADDRAYLARTISSDVCQKIDRLTRSTQVEIGLFVIDPHPHDGIDQERERMIREEIAGQLLVTLGCFPDLLVKEMRPLQSIPLVAMTGRYAFMNLPAFVRDARERRRFTRFAEQFFRYVDILLVLQETHRKCRFAPDVLEPLAIAGSRFAKDVLSPHTRQ